MRPAALAAACLLAGAGCGGNAPAHHAPAGTVPTSRAASAPAAGRTTGPALHVAALLRLPVGVSRTVVVPDAGRLLVLGGLAPGDTTTARVWRVDPRSRAVVPAAPLGLAVHDASGAVVAGRPTVFGGGSATTVATVQQWGTGGARPVGRLPQPRSDSAAVTIGTTAYVVGGFTGGVMARDVLATTDGRTFRRVARLPIGVRYPAVAAVGNVIVVVGGALATTEGTASGAQTAAVQRIDVTTGKVTVVGRLSRPLAHATAFTLGGSLFVAGGRHGAVASRAILRVDPRSGTETRVAELPIALSDAGVAVVGGTAYLVGGETSGPAAPSSSVLALRLAG